MDPVATSQAPGTPRLQSRLLSSPRACFMMIHCLLAASLSKYPRDHISHGCLRPQSLTATNKAPQICPSGFRVYSSIQVRLHQLRPRAKGSDHFVMLCWISDLGSPLQRSLCLLQHHPLRLRFSSTRAPHNETAVRKPIAALRA